MATVSQFYEEAGNPAVSAVERKQLRGSGLLLAGRGISVALTTLSQVLIVRHLATNDFGAWAYALAVVMFWQSAANLGFHEAVTRFVPIYHERGEYPKLFGTIVLCCGFILLSSALVVLTFYAWPDKVLALVHQQGSNLKVLFVLIFLVPAEALDTLLMGLFASLVGAGSIFARRHLVSPLLKLLVVLLLIGLHAGVLFLAYGYLFTTIAGIAVYSWILVRHLHREGMLARFSLRGMRLPMREVFSFTVPMVSSDLLALLIQSVAVFLLGYYHGMREVAFYRVVLPAAAMNQTVAITSALLYLPAAARLFAAGDYPGLRHLYWRTATWVATLSLPIFAATYVFARPMTVLLYGSRYADAGILLAILAVGYYYDVLFGFNGLTLKALNKLTLFVGSNLVAAVTGVVVDLILIPKYGALGAAIGTAVILIVSTTLRQVALGLVLGIGIFQGKFLSFYGPLGLALISLFGIHLIVRPNFVLAAGLALISTGAALLFARKELGVAEVFPESTRIPLVSRLFHWAARNSA
jgi:O-antigen/teichoic acid export membrane protein